MRNNNFMKYISYFMKYLDKLFYIIIIKIS